MDGTAPADAVTKSAEQQGFFDGGIRRDTFEGAVLARHGLVRPPAGLRLVRLAPPDSFSSTRGIAWVDGNGVANFVPLDQVERLWWTPGGEPS